MAVNANKVKHELFEWLKALLVAFVIVFLVRWLAFNNYIVDGRSMEPNFSHGERVIVNKLIYPFREPRRGEVIVFLAPEGKDYIKRVIGLPGERVKVIGDTVYVNGTPIDEPYIREEVERARAEGGSYNIGSTEEFVVPDDALFVLGDNRPESLDSRSSFVGFVPLDNVKGRADLVYWPIGDFRFVQHDFQGAADDQP
jgi:signal peptidase I